MKNMFEKGIWKFEKVQKRYVKYLYKNTGNLQ